MPICILKIYPDNFMIQSQNLQQQTAGHKDLS